MMMKRVFWHVAFWIVYCFQDTFWGFSWVKSLFPGVSDGHIFTMVLEDALICLIPKFIFTYFLMIISVPQLVSGKYPINRIVAGIIPVLGVSLFVYRLQAYYIIDPLVYGLPKKGSLLSLAGVSTGFTDIGFASCMAVALKFTRLQLTIKENEKNLVRGKLEAELKFLRHQTSPHFLLNTLNNVYALARKKSDETPEVVMKLSELLRFILYESGDRFIPLMDEIKVLEDYLRLEMMRYDERLTVRFEKKLDVEGYQIVPLLLLPFIENAFKHGISESRFESYVYIEIGVVNGQLIYMVENSKDGTNREMSKKNIGLANVRRRLELTYTKYDLDIREEENSYRVNLSINLLSHVEI
jgi:two-component system LytT family sensor kinase